MSEAIIPEVVATEVVEPSTEVTTEVTPIQQFKVEMHDRLVAMSPEAALSWQYNRCNRSAAAYVIECCKFGDMLATVDAGLARQRYCRADQRVGNAQSLKEWLGEHCPEIKYDTAKSYQYAAVGVRRIVEVEASKPLLPYLSRTRIDNDAEEVVRRRMLDVVNTSSLNFLRKAANPEVSINALKGSVGIATGRRALTAEEKAQEATALKKELIGKLAAYLKSGQFKLLEDTEMRDMVIALQSFAKMFEDQIPLN